MRLFISVETIAQAQAAIACGAQAVLAARGAPVAALAATIAGRALVGAYAIEAGVDFRLAPYPDGLNEAPERRIGVLYADQNPDPAVLAAMPGQGFQGIMLDVADRDGRRLIDHMDLARIDAFVRAGRAAGLSIILSGALEPPDIPRLALAAPDALAFGPGGLDPRTLTLIRAMTSPQEIAAGPAETDLVFLRDFIAPISIGAYDYERGAPQRVRFCVEARVARARLRGDDMREAFSYDVIRDAIAILAHRGHVTMVETLAEELARMVLLHPRVKEVMARVEKLDIIDGALGVEIRRGRETAG